MTTTSPVDCGGVLDLEILSGGGVRGLKEVFLALTPWPPPISSPSVESEDWKEKIFALKKKFKKNMQNLGLKF